MSGRMGGRKGDRFMSNRMGGREVGREGGGKVHVQWYGRESFMSSGMGGRGGLCPVFSVSSSDYNKQYLMSTRMGGGIHEQEGWEGGGFMSTGM